MASLRLSFEAGALIRRQQIRALRAIAFRHNLTLSTDEDRGLLDSQFLLTFRGEPGRVKEALKEIAAHIAVSEAFYSDG